MFKSLIAKASLVALAIMIGAGALWAARADEIDTTSCNGNLINFYRDADSDSYGDPAQLVQACTQPAGYVANSLDCDDALASVNPEAVEVCDTIDNDCDGAIDEGVKLTFYFDGDADNYGVTATTTTGCSAPAGFVAADSDCNDANAAVYPGGFSFATAWTTTAMAWSTTIAPPPRPSTAMPTLTATATRAWPQRAPSSLQATCSTQATATTRIRASIPARPRFATASTTTATARWTKA